MSMIANANGSLAALPTDVRSGPTSTEPLVTAGPLCDATPPLPRHRGHLRRDSSSGTRRSLIMYWLLEADLPWADCLFSGAQTCPEDPFWFPRDCDGRLQRAGPGWTVAWCANTWPISRERLPCCIHAATLNAAVECAPPARAWPRADATGRDLAPGRRPGGFQPRKELTINVAVWAEIRRLAEIEQLSGWAIARRLHCSRHTVAAALELDQPPTRHGSRRASLLDPYRSKIDALVAQYPEL